MKKVKEKIKGFTLECIKKGLKIKEKVIEEVKVEAKEEKEEVKEKKPKKSYEKAIIQADLPKTDYSFLDMNGEQYIAYLLHRPIPGKQKEEEDY